MDRKLILTLIVSFLFVNAFAQELKFRIGANGSTFQKEVGSPEVEYPFMSDLYAPDYAYTDYSSALELGFEAEVMLLWTPHFETGLEFNYAKMSGENDIPPYNNHILSLNYDPTAGTITPPPLLPLSYETSVISAALNGRYYFLPDEVVNPFVKVFGGVSMVGTDFNYKDPADIITYGTRVGFSNGTKDSENPREPAFYYGFGGGLNFKFSERLALYVDYSASFINSDKVDGIPNYNYSLVDGKPYMEPVSNTSFFTQLSIGFVFYTGKNLGWVSDKGDGSSKSSVKKTGRTTNHLPFYRQK